MTRSVHERAVRILGNLPGFKATFRARHEESSVPLRTNEHVIGAYRAGDGTPVVVLTDAGLRVLEPTGWRFLPYDELTPVAAPAKRPPATSIVLRGRHGDEVEIPMRADDRTSDAFEWVRFLDRVASDSAARPRALTWAHPSVKAFVPANMDPVAFVTERARAMVYEAIQKGWTGPPFDPLSLARLRGIDPFPNSGLDDARLVSVGSGFRIEFNPNRPPARVRYSIAHELAHSIFPDAALAVRNRGRDADEWQLELLCNVAAAELLMPVGSLATALDDRPLGVELMLELREKFLVSLEAVAIRLVRANASEVAAFVAAPTERTNPDEHGYELEYVVASAAWSLPRLQGRRLPPTSIVSQITAVGFTGVSPQPERWGTNLPALHVEAVGVPPYPGSRLPRVAGLIWPGDGTPVHKPGIRFLRGSALAPVGSGAKLIAHVVNDTAPLWGGRSFAAQIRREWPAVQADFKAWAATDEYRLGSVHVAEVGEERAVASLVAMHGYGRLVRPGIRYEALERCLDTLAGIALERQAGVHMPRIGTGNARGNWDVIAGMIEEALVARGVEVTVYLIPDPDPTRTPITP